MKKLIQANILVFFTVLFASCGCCKKAVASSNITFYKVPLVCGAASEIGCGSKAKPVLLDLEKKNDVVKEAWLNRSGTAIAVVWKENISDELRKNNADAVFKENNMEVTLVTGKDEKFLLKDFESKNNWYRGADVDKLSIEEAGIIADRLISRVNAKTPLNKDKMESLKTDFVQVFKNRFTKNYTSEINSDEQKVFDENKKQMEEDILSSGKKYLNETEMIALKEAVSLGLKPTESESKDTKGCCSPKKHPTKTVELKKQK